jgi:hypothetical protein
MSKFPMIAAAVVMSLGITSTALAADCTSNSCSGNLSLLYPSPSSNLVYVQPSGSTSALQCTTVNSKYVTMKLDTEVKRGTWQLLLAAFLAGKSVLMKLNTTGTCEIQYITVAP